MRRKKEDHEKKVDDNRKRTPRTTMVAYAPEGGIVENNIFLARKRSG
jgi:hypothetical protein